jgi:hypothetical protein
MKFDVRGARKEGYSDAEIADYLATQRKFDLTGARNEGYSDTEIVNYLSTPAKRHPFKAGFEAARSQLTEGLPYAVEKKFGTVTPEEEAAYSAKLRASNARQEELLPGGPAALGKDPLLSVIGENLAYSSPQMAASLGAGLAGGAVGTMVAPGAGTLAGAALPLLAGTAASTPFFVGSNVDRATAGGEEALTEDEAGRAMLAAPAQAAVDVVSDRFVPGMGRLLGAPAKKVAAEVVGKGAKEAILRTAKRTGVGALKGAASEGIAEPLQQVGERWAAGEELANQDALREYGQAAATAAILGGAMGGVGAQFEHKVEPPVQTEPEDQEQTPGAPPPPDQGRYPVDEETFGMEPPKEPVTEEQFNITRQDLMDLYGMSPDEASLAAAQELGVPIKPEAPNAAGQTDVGGGEPSVPSAGRKRQGRRPAPEAPNLGGEGLGAPVQPVSGPPQGESPVGPALTEEPDEEEYVAPTNFDDAWVPPTPDQIAASEPQAAQMPKPPKGGGKNLTRKQREIMTAEQLRLDRGFARNVLDDAPPPDTSHWTEPQTPASEPVVDTAVAATPEIAPVKVKKQRAAPVPAPVQDTAAPAKPQQKQTTKPSGRGTWEVRSGDSEPLTIVNRNLGNLMGAPAYFYGDTPLNPNGENIAPRDAGAIALQVRAAESVEEAAQGPEFEAPTAEKFKGKPKIVAAEEALAAISTPNPLNEREMLIGTPTGGVTLKIGMDGIHVHDLRAIERSGGRKALEAVLKIADDHGLQVGLNAIPGESHAGKKMTEAKLRAWYRGFGFEAERGGTYMVRKPQAVEQPTATAEKAAKPKRGKGFMGSYEETLEDGTKVQVRQFQSNVAKGAYKGATSAKLYSPAARVEEAEELTSENEQQQAVSAKINKAFADNKISQNEMAQLRNRLRMPDSGEKQISLSRLGEETRAMFADPYKDTATPGSGWHPQRVSEELDRLLASPRRNRNAPDISVISGQTQFEEASPAAPKGRTSVEAIRTVKDAVASGKLQPAVRAIATSETAPPHLKALASKLDAGGVGDVKISVKDYGDRALRFLGTSDLASGEVILNKTNNGASGYTLETLLHEAIHTFIQKRYHTLGKYLDSNKARVGAKDQVADPFIKEFQGLWRQFHDAIFANPELLAKARTPEAAWLREAVNSPDELLTRIFTEETLRDFLKTIDMQGNPLPKPVSKPVATESKPAAKSFWDRVVDLFAKLFGITKPNERAALEEVMDSGTPRSAFDDVLESGDRLLSAATQDKPTGEYAEQLRALRNPQAKKTMNARAPGRPRRAQQTPPHVTTAANAPNNVPTPPSGFKSAARKAGPTLREQGQRLLDVALQKLNYAYQGAVVADRYIKNAMGAQPDERQLDKAFEQTNARKSNRKELFVRRLVKPLIAKMAELKLDMHDVDMYLWARGAAGRNAALLRKNGTVNGSGLSDADAQAIIDEYRNRGILADLDTIAAMHDRIVRFNLDTMVDAGLITRRTATAMLAAHPNYTPMTGIALEGDITEEGEIDGGTKKLTPTYYGSRTREFMSAGGRGSMPASPLTHLMQNVAGTIVRAENNRVGQVLVRLAAQNNLATDGIFHVLHSVPPGTSSNYHVVKVGGASKYVSFANTDAGNALKAAFQSLSPKEMGTFVKGWTTVANVMKRLMTTWNPAFLGTAFTRDVFDSLAAAKAAETDKTSPAYGKPLANEMRKYMNMEVFKGVMSYVAGKSPRPGTNEFRIHAALDSMAANGGSVGSTMLHNSEDFKDEIKKQLSDAAALNAKDPVGNAAKVLKIVGDSMDRTAHAFDLFPRVATYMGALRTGMSQTDAARVSLNSSLNLTRRGEWARVLDNTFFFFSPTVEGARKFTKMGLTSANGTKLMATFAGIGGMATLMNSMMAGGDDDDDGRPNYMDVPKVTQQTRLVIFHGPGSDDYFSIPLGFMMAYPTYVGTRATQALLGATSGESAGVMMTEAAGDMAAGLASSMSPLRPAGDQVQESVASLAPSMVKPFTDLAVNRNYFGSNIYNKQFDNRIARSTMGRESTGKVWEWLATTLNESTGGSGNTAGWMDLQPEQYRYLFEAYAGGPYRTIKDSVKAFDGGNEETGLARVPIIRGFVGKGSEYVPMNQYFKNTKELASLEYSERTSDTEVWEKQVKKFPVDTDPRIMDAYVGAEKELDALRRFRLNELRSTDDTKEKRDIIKEYRELNREVYADFNKTYNEVRKDIQNPTSE